MERTVDQAPLWARRRDPGESIREEAAAWRAASLEDRDRALDGLCELAAEALSFRTAEERARTLGFQLPRSEPAEAQWREFVRRARARRGSEDAAELRHAPGRDT